MVIIIDYQMGNIGSIINMLKKIGYEAKISNNIDEINNADKLILPGVGSFDNGMKNLKEFDLIDILNKKVLEDKTPIIGICLGMQLITNRSEEGNLPGLGWIDAETVKFKFGEENEKLKIPHMGWNTVIPQNNSNLFNGLEEPRFYFVHSYHVVCKNNVDIIGKTNYGHNFNSVINKDNIYGAQFHPEKSHKYGMLLLKNFLGIN